MEEVRGETRNTSEAYLIQIIPTLDFLKEEKLTEVVALVSVPPPPSHGAIYPRVSVESAGRPGAGGGWYGGNAELSDYATSPVVGAGAGGGQGYVGIMSRRVSYAYGTSGRSMEPWNTLQPADKNGIVRITIDDYAGAY